MSRKSNKTVCVVCGEDIYGPEDGKFYMYTTGREHCATLRIFGIPMKKYYMDTTDYVHARCREEYNEQRKKEKESTLTVLKDVMILCTFIGGFLVLWQMLLGNL